MFYSFQSKIKAFLMAASAMVSSPALAIASLYDKLGNITLREVDCIFSKAAEFLDPKLP